jgi:hypothetical protein
MAEIVTEPNPVSYAGNPIFVAIQTDAIDNTQAYVQIRVSGSPAAAQVLRIDYTGGTITYTAAAVQADTGLTFPIQLPGESLPDYADRIADALREREDITDVFTITRAAAIGADEVILMTRSVKEIFGITIHTDTLANVAVTAFPKTTNTTPAALRARVDVFTENGFNNDQTLLQAHATYPTDSDTVQIDISPAFADMEYTLPNTTTINPSPSNFQIHLAESHLREYYLRYADKFGTPAIAERLRRSPSNYLALLGAAAPNAIFADPSNLVLHNYSRIGGLSFIKPVMPYQPDWVYFLPTPDGVDGTGFYVSILVYWSDGTTSVSTPFGTTARNFTMSKVNYLKSGYRQNNLHLLSPSGGTDATAHIVAYDFRLIQTGGSTVPIITVKYEVNQLAELGNMVLLYTNGVGGLETCSLSGVSETGYAATRETWRKYLGDYDTLLSEGSPQINVSSGYYSESYYLLHLQQLMHAKCWLVDIENDRFLRVLIDNSVIDNVTKDDTNLYSIQLKINAAWVDQEAYNI